MYLAKIYQEKTAKKMLVKMSDHFDILGGTFRWRRPCVSKIPEAIERGEFTLIRISDGKSMRPKGENALADASRFFNLGGKPPHQHRHSKIATIRAITEGEIDLINSEGKGFWDAD